jgi:hypothetical protein
VRSGGLRLDLGENVLPLSGLRPTDAGSGEPLLQLRVAREAVQATMTLGAAALEVLLQPFALAGR